MRRKILLSTLSVGRCFVYDAGAEQSADKVGAVVRTDMAWRVVSTTEDGAACERADGVEMKLPGIAQVAEIPVEGFQKLRATYLAALDEEG